MISFIYFDVGGVIIKDFSGTNKWEIMKKDLGVTTAQNLDFDAYWDMYEPKMDKGLDVDSFIPQVRKIFNINSPKNYSFLDDFTSRFKRNKSVWDLIARVHTKYPIGLLTNMYPKLLNNLHKEGLMPLVTWDTIIDSSKVGFRKPEPQIYHIAQKAAGVKAEEIFFIDNLKQNLEGAKKQGWQTFLYDPLNPQESNKMLENILIH